MAASGGLEGPQTSPQGPICSHMPMKRRPTIVPAGNQVALGARSSATCYGLRPTCRPSRDTGAPRGQRRQQGLGSVRERACKAPTKLGPEQDVLGCGSGDVLQVQIGSHFKEQFGRKPSWHERFRYQLTYVPAFDSGTWHWITGSFTGELTMDPTAPMESANDRRRTTFEQQSPDALDSARRGGLWSRSNH